MINKNILICGGSHGLGFLIAKNFLIENINNVIIVSRNKNKLQKAKKIINSNKVSFYRCDLSNENSVKLLMKKLKKKYKSIDTVISSAGTSNMKKTGQENYNEWIRAFNLNFFLHTNLVESYTKYFKNKKLKKMIFISSIAAYQKGGAPLSYSLAKNSLNLYVENISKHLSKFKININTISPGHILQKDNLWDKKIKKDKRKVTKLINQSVSLKRFCKPDDVINIINFLVSNKSNYITGADFKVDGNTL